MRPFPKLPRAFFSSEMFETLGDLSPFETLHRGSSSSSTICPMFSWRGAHRRPSARQSSALSLGETTLLSDTDGCPYVCEIRVISSNETEVSLEKTVNNKRSLAQKKSAERSHGDSRVANGPPLQIPPELLQLPRARSHAYGSTESRPFRFKMRQKASKEKKGTRPPVVHPSAVAAKRFLVWQLYDCSRIACKRPHRVRGAHAGRHPW